MRNLLLICALLAMACGKKPSDEHEVESQHATPNTPTPDTESSGADRAGSTSAARATDDPHAGPGGGSGSSPNRDGGVGDAGTRGDGGMGR